MRRFLISIVLSMLALTVTVWIVPGLDFDGSVWQLAGIALLFGLVNVTVRPLVMLLSSPLIILTLGIAALFVNGLMFWFVVWISDLARADLGLTSSGFWPAFWGAIVMSIVGFGLGVLTGTRK